MIEQNSLNSVLMILETYEVRGIKLTSLYLRLKNSLLIFNLRISFSFECMTTRVIVNKKKYDL